MWILPKQLHTSAYAPDTAALISDSSEQSQACAQSLLVRSKPSPARTWSLKWKRDSWTRHLSGRILRPSHGPSFVAAWTSSLGAIHASHSAPPGSDSVPTIPATFGHSSQTELDLCDPDSASLRTSRDTSALDSAQSLKNWQALVTRRRGEYLARVKSVRPTSASGCSSWPTASASEDAAGTPNGKMQWMLSQAARTGCATRKDYLESTWPTPQARDFKDTPGDQCARNTLNLGRAVHGRLAPANPSTSGSRQGLWATPRAGKTGDENAEAWARRNAKGDVHTMPLTMQVQAWATPHANCSTGSGQAPGKQGAPNLQTQVQAWATPRSCSAMAATITPEAANKEGRFPNLETQVGRRMTENHGKLNPRWVETLMGLPVGWVMPSCASPVTIAPTNCDCSATGSSRP